MAKKRVKESLSLMEMFMKEISWKTIYKDKVKLCGQTAQLTKEDF